MRIPVIDFPQLDSLVIIIAFGFEAYAWRALNFGLFRRGVGARCVRSSYSSNTPRLSRSPPPSLLTAGPSLSLSRPRLYPSSRSSLQPPRSVAVLRCTRGPPRLCQTNATTFRKYESYEEAAVTPTSSYEPALPRTAPSSDTFARAV